MLFNKKPAGFAEENKTLLSHILLDIETILDDTDHLKKIHKDKEVEEDTKAEKEIVKYFNMSQDDLIGIILDQKEELEKK